MSALLRQHWAALRALLVLTVIAGVVYPAMVWAVARLPGLHGHAEGSLLRSDSSVVGSSLIGQSFTDAHGHALPQYFQSRPSASGYDTSQTGGSNLGPESILDTPGDPTRGGSFGGAAAGYRPGLLTTVCARSAAIGARDHVDGSRPFCTPAHDAYGASVGAVLALLGPRDSHGNVTAPTRVISVNEPCTGRDGTEHAVAPFLTRYRGVPVECSDYAADRAGTYAAGALVPIRGTAPAHPAVPADAVTAGASGLDPDISPAYADLQIDRVAAARHTSPQQVRILVARNTNGRDLGFLGEPTVRVLPLNLALDREFPVPRQLGAGGR